MKKLILAILAFIFISKTVFAAGYVGLTDYDVQRFILLVNEVAEEAKKDNDGFSVEFFTKKYGSESFAQKDKLVVLETGLSLAILILTYHNPAEFQQMEDAGIDVYSYSLKEIGIDNKDAEVLSRHEKEFMDAAALCLN